MLASYSQLVKLLQVDLSLMMIKLVTIEESWMTTSVLLVVLGTVIGILGSVISIRKYLKV
ncbi:hypothetical protein D3C80_1921310 [compost metagenome]